MPSFSSLARRLPARLSTQLHLRPHPFRTLLYLEWVLLTISLLTPIFGQVIDTSVESEPLLFLPPEVRGFWGCVVIFGLLGLRLPSDRTGGKVLYTGLEFALAWLAGYLCYWDGVGFAPLLLVAAIRSCLLLQKMGRVAIAATLFAFFILYNDDFSYSLQADDFLIMPADLITETQEELSNLQLEQTRLQEELAFLKGLPPEAAIPLESSAADNPLDNQQENLLFLQYQLQATFFFGLVLVFVLLLINALLSERENRRKLASAHAQLYDYAIRIEDQATLQERNRIARDIHDSLGHTLTAQSIQLENGLFFLPDRLPDFSKGDPKDNIKGNPNSRLHSDLENNLQKAQTFFRAGKQLSTAALQELRQSVSALRCHPAQEKDLSVLITQLADNFSKMVSTEISRRVDIDQPIPREVHTAIFRIVEEALTNIHKHARATKVIIQLRTESPDEKQPLLHFLIEDNGMGFVPAQNATGFGLRGMHERTNALGGQLEIVSKLGQGCRIVGYFPLRSAFGEA